MSLRVGIPIRILNMEVGKAYPVLMGRIDDKDKTKKERERQNKEIRDIDIQTM